MTLSHQHLRRVVLGALVLLPFLLSGGPAEAAGESGAASGAVRRSFLNHPTTTGFVRKVAGQLTAKTSATNPVELRHKGYVVVGNVKPITFPDQVQGRQFTSNPLQPALGWVPDALVGWILKVRLDIEKQTADYAIFAPDSSGSGEVWMLLPEGVTPPAATRP
jgi:hypothetical protein